MDKCLSKGKKDWQQRQEVFVGIHLSGASSQKTSLTALENLTGIRGSLVVKEIFEKIGSQGKVFSDDRLINILATLDGIKEVFVDCPITHPPCVACKVDSCPGVWKCSDLSVAYMLSLSEKIRKTSQKRRKRALNPQSQRLWDVVRLWEKSEAGGDSSYSSNIAPLVNRARTLEKRIRSSFDGVSLLETSVSQTLFELGEFLELSPNKIAISYKNFESGKNIRKLILEKMEQKNLISFTEEHFKFTLSRSVENFHSFIASWVNAQKSQGKTLNRPHDFIDHEGWVYLPRM